MEKINNGCILLKQKEYDDLIEKSKASKSKEIRLRWSYSNGMFNRNSPSLYAGGDIILSDKIHQQITSILNNVDIEFERTRVKISDIQKSNDRREFSKLSWWKRLTFKA